MAQTEEFATLLSPSIRWNFMLIPFMHFYVRIVQLYFSRWEGVERRSCWWWWCRMGMAWTSKETVPGTGGRHWELTAKTTQARGFQNLFGLPNVWTLLVSNTWQASSKCFQDQRLNGTECIDMHLGLQHVLFHLFQYLWRPVGLVHCCVNCMVNLANHSGAFLR